MADEDCSTTTVSLITVVSPAEHGANVAPKIAKKTKKSNFFIYNPIFIILYSLFEFQLELSH
jgi:hypothetical protein